MPSDPVTICNLALGRLGQSKIVSLDDASQSARYCKLFFAPTRDEVLRSHPWNFAKKRQVLTKFATAPAFGWTNAFALPVDWLRTVRFNEWESFQMDDNWTIEGQTILTDEDTAQLLYIASTEDTGLFDPIFVTALSVMLAAKLVTALTGSREQGQAFESEFQNIISPLAKRIDGMESHDKRKLPWVNSDLVNARFGGGSLF